MRKKDREITSAAAIDKLLSKAPTCRLGMCVENAPYVVPMNFAHNEMTVYVHCAKKGKRYDMLRQNPNVCFEVDIDGGFLPSDMPDNACKSDYAYQSLIGFGKVRVVEDSEEKTKVLDAICQKYFGESMPMKAEAIRGTLVLSIKLEEVTMKQSGSWDD